jgi:hypothetical protein
MHHRSECVYIRRCIAKTMEALHGPDHTRETGRARMLSRREILLIILLMAFPQESITRETSVGDGKQRMA